MTNTDVHLVPVIRNTPREPELVSQLEEVLPTRASRWRARSWSATTAYIWGDDILAAKRHTEVYHFLFEATAQWRGRQSEERA